MRLNGHGGSSGDRRKSDFSTVLPAGKLPKNNIIVIQRIQTVFLLLVLPVNIGFAFTPMFSHAMLDPSGWLSNGLIAALLFSMALSVFAVFLFRNRPNQMRWVKRAMFFQLIAIGMNIGIFFTVGRIGMNLLTEVFSVGLLALALVFQYLALHYIDKDEKLVKSMDRIR
ncbi:MAG: DUF4293 family protein [Balneolaceae bacterium]|nr:MAG: DUF4293 family protein [Balneolaceae bacterium]